MVHALVFDSGVGGLSVATHMRALMPDLHLTYAADDAFRPYGEKSEAALRARLPGLLKVLTMASGADIVVLACNTASTIALSHIRDVLDIPVVGVVPAIKPATLHSKTKTIAVLGTPGTVRQKYVRGLIDTFTAGYEIIVHGSTKLVAQAENKLSGLGVDMGVIAHEISPLLAHKNGSEIDTIVLACTHFPFLVDELQACVAHNVSWVDSGAAIAARTKDLTKYMPKESIDAPRTALLIGGANTPERSALFAKFGFEKTVTLPDF
ncbi:MAG: glutamate racemase [Robiginitomaculum sp.]